MLPKTRYCKENKDYYLNNLQTMFCEGKLQLILPEHIIMAEKKHGVEYCFKQDSFDNSM